MSSRRHKVVLYNPEAPFYTMPLPLLAVGSALDSRRYDVRILDGRIESGASRVLAEIDDAICLGVSVHTGAPIRDALEISRAAKARRPHLPVVWGGWYPSLFPLDPLADSAIDVTIQAQGETSFAEVLDHLTSGGDLSGIAGLAFRSDSGPVMNPPRGLRDVNELPAHDYERIPVESYFRAKRQRQLDYIASMGCRFRCAFCADPLVYKRAWVALDPLRVSSELEHLWHRFGFTDVVFQDETFFTDRAWVARVAEELLRRGTRFTWMATMRADQGMRLPEETWKLCARAGLRRVLIGVESGFQPMLDWMQKDHTVEEVLSSAEQCRRYAIGAVFPFIVGFPGETDASVEATLELAKRLRAMSPKFDTPVFYYQPYPGSPIATEAVRLGYHLPRSLEEWAEFELVDSSAAWVSEAKRERIERFRFYNRFAGGPETWRRWPLQVMARWRMKRDLFALPVEKMLVDFIKPLSPLA